MLDKRTRQAILSKGKPEPCDVPWWGEPNLGGWYTEAEVEAATEAIRQSMPWSVGFGPNAAAIEEFERAFAQYCGVRHAIATNSGGTALDLAMRCLDLEPGDEVICPAVNFKASHLAILGQGGKVVFCDIDPRTLNLDPADLARRITPRTRAICPVHMNGLAAPMDEVAQLAACHRHRRHGPLKIIGDAARSCGATYRGRRIGSHGWMTVFSFHTQKLMTTLGEGGMITTDDDVAAERLRAIRQFGGEEEWGSNYKMTKVQAAVGLVQLRRLDEMNACRRQAAKRRSRLLEGVAELTLPYEPPDCEHLYYVYGLLVCRQWAGQKRDAILSRMKEGYGIHCSVSNVPTYQRWPYIARQCGAACLPASEDVGRRLVCPPLHPLFSEEQELYVCASLLETIEEVRYG